MPERATTSQEISVTAGTAAKPNLQQRAKTELREFAIIAAYVYVTLGAITLMKTAVLHTYGVEISPYGIVAVKAMVLAKFMLLGRAMKIGEGVSDKPLIWPTLYRAVAFLLLLVVMTLIEEAVVGLFHHRSIADSLGDLLGVRLEETIVGYVLALLVLIPFFACRVLSEALGEGRLERMFFIEREPPDRA